MLKLVNIKKDYVMKDQAPVHALKGLTINFRRNEFVAILGQSGCGKTTLLNITGGLDRYTSGDLVIDGVSTKNFTDRDWDTYRNHSIGFVFQSYNLIPHQTILKNVELALTISGIEKNERKERALNALAKVGLAGLEKKKPNQLSGGQMQRVAIARALVNEPEIVLADEPTGALDSETSIQIMDLLKEVAKDCLVIMVTHNPELAEAYANRIVKMKDGELLSDSNPYSDEDEAKDSSIRKERPIEKSNKGNKKKSSMSFWTATSLSFSNLLSKLKRTILIAVAGSIGIIGVSAVLAVSHGVTNYVDNMQDDMLSEYPLGIAEKSIDISSLMNGLSNWEKKEAVQFDIRTEVGLNSMVKYLMDRYNDLFSVKENDINKELIAYIEAMNKDYVSSISYDYSIDPTNNIFTTWNRGGEGDEDEIISLNGLTQMYIAELATVPEFGTFSIFMDLFTNFMKQIPGDETFVNSQYDLIAGNAFPKEENELLLVVDDDQTLTDLVFAQVGYYTQKEFLHLALESIKESEGKDGSEYHDYPEKFTFEQLLNKEFYYVPDVYSWNTIHAHKLKYYVDLSAFNPSFKTVEFDMTYSETNSGGIITGTGFGLPLVLTRKNPITITDKPWVGEWDGILSIPNNGETVKINYVVDIKEDETAQISFITGYSSGYLPYTYEYAAIDSYNYNAFQTENIKNDDIEAIPMKITGIIKRKKGLNFGSLDRGLYYTPAFTRKYIENGLGTDIVKSTDTSKPGLASYIINQTNKEYEAHVRFSYSSFANGDVDSGEIVENGYASSLNLSLSNSISGMFAFNQTTNIDVNRKYLRSVAGISSRKNALGIYEISDQLDDQMPEKISIYPKDFDNKKKVTNYLKEWNDENKNITVVVDGVEKTLTPDMRTELSYTDTVEVIINIINSLITTITVALVAFTSLSLVVSCFMIAVITYISTMERIKEIGVIRSLGGRKKDVSRLFIAECLIIGLASGLFGIIVTYIFEIIFNIAIAGFGVGNMADLTFLTALIMVLISVGLNVLSGFIPSRRASKQDPVVALRSE